MKQIKKINKLKILIFLLCIFSICTIISNNTIPAGATPNLMNAKDNLTTVGGNIGYSTNEGTTLEVTIGNMIQVILSLLGIFFLILVIIGGYQWMTAGGNEETITKAKKRIINATTGVAVVLGAYVISYFLIYRLLVVAGF